MIKKHNVMKKIIISLLGAAVISVFFSLSFFVQTANSLSDAVYLSHETPSSEIILIGMDNRAIEKYGSMPWDRQIMAQAVDKLCESEENKPAVIGIDALYTTQTNEQSDAMLANAVENAQNVVLASNIYFDSELVLEGNAFYMDGFEAISIEQPIEALNNVAKIGHANAMFDADGILRHAIWEVELPNGETHPSFNGAIYSEYMEYLDNDKINTPPIDENGGWYLPYTSKPGSYDDGYSIVDLIDGKIDPKIFAGKIVLIGPYAMEMNDEYITAIDHSQKMFGVEYQANAINALITGNFKQEVPAIYQQILLFAVSFVCLIWFYKRGMVSSLISFIILAVLWVSLCLALWHFGVFMHIFYVLCSITICFLFSVGANYLLSTIEKRRITNSFKRYIEPQIVAKLVENGNTEPSIGGELTQVAVLFADIRGFTSLAESLTPAEVAHILNKYLSLMSECVFAQNGTLDKFMGDCTMAFWGAPLKQDDIVYKAVCAASEIAEKSQKLNDYVKQKYSHEIGVGIGINFGSAIVGNFGSQKRMDYTVIGDTVNTAARIQAIAKSGTVLVTKQAADMIKARFELTAFDKEVSLKGKSHQVKIFVVGEKL